MNVRCLAYGNNRSYCSEQEGAEERREFPDPLLN
jgi:hypothetical protein